MRDLDDLLGSGSSSSFSSSLSSCLDDFFSFSLDVFLADVFLADVRLVLRVALVDVLMDVLRLERREVFFSAGGSSRFSLLESSAGRDSMSVPGRQEFKHTSHGGRG